MSPTPHRHGAAQSPVSEQCIQTLLIGEVTTSDDHGHAPTHTDTLRKAPPMAEPEPSRPDWARTLRQARRHRGWDVRRLAQELADSAGRESTATTESLIRRIHQWEAGKHTISERYRYLIRRVLHLDADTLAPATPPPGSPATHTFGTLTDSPRLAEDVAHTLRQAHTVLAQAAPEAVVNLLEADVERLCRSYVSTPLTHLYPQIVERRIAALTLLPTLTHPDQSRRIHTVAARLVGLQAHLCLDLGAYAHAVAHTDAARALADNTGDPAALAWTHALHSLIAYWDGRYDDAQHAAEAGLDHGATDSNLTRLHALRARAAAVQGDTAVTRSAIAAAQDHAHLPVLPGVLGFPSGKIHAYAGTAFLSLGSQADRQRSVDHAERAIALYSTGPDRSVGDLLAARLDLTTAHLSTGEWDGALEQITIITATPGGHRTASITQRARRLLPLLSHTRAAPARRIRAHLEAFEHTPGSVPAREG